jgi:hypothetical protein
MQLLLAPKSIYIKRKNNYMNFQRLNCVTMDVTMQDIESKQFALALLTYTIYRNDIRLITGHVRGEASPRNRRVEVLFKRKRHMLFYLSEQINLHANCGLDQ